MRSIQVEQHLADWADAAWKKADGVWEQAGPCFIEVRDEELPKLDPVLAQEIEDEVWRFFGNQQINKIVQRLRMESRTVAPIPPVTTTAPPTGGNSRRTAAATSSNQATRERCYLDTFYLTTSKVKLREATFDQVVKERTMRGKKARTAGKDERMLIDLEDKLRAEGFSEGDPRPIGDGLQDDYVDQLRKKHYAV